MSSVGLKDKRIVLVVCVCLIKTKQNPL